MRILVPFRLALVSVGHEERLREHEYAPMRLAAHNRLIRRGKPSANRLVSRAFPDDSP